MGKIAFLSKYLFLLSKPSSKPKNFDRESTKSSKTDNGFLNFETQATKNSQLKMQFVAGKYVPPHMRQRPAGLEAVPARAPGCEPKRRNFTKKVTKPKPVVVEAPKVEEPKVKPHCELFLADLPAPMRSVTTLAGFFHPYGEISNIQIIPVGQSFPEECHKFIDTAEYKGSFCAIVEFLTARVAKFVVGVLRKRIEALNFRVGLLKPGLAEEMAHQSMRLKDSLHRPSFQINKTQDGFLNAPILACSSEELSDQDSNIRHKRAIFSNTWSNTSSGIDTGASSSASGLDSDSDRLHRLISSTDDDEDYDLLTLALKNGIKVTRSPPGFQ
ncbi:Oidioi.mRNA.OKI2018_I69.chr1.g3759.t1.cds [Oikopleura dioica]|uniref:Oidioi.mRNA.OKI2018_I69.chr1.g3759.t1.cds n=1 Tax=Oikopleura dioica TaxID=34765 RepID=A0ABN7T206_OIKDI|nr:Oidioi.mRNA.OKI2018_I69.chr1.g3759.t1.cds [Oikopleura dioica]